MVSDILRLTDSAFAELREKLLAGGWPLLTNRDGSVELSPLAAPFKLMGGGEWPGDQGERGVPTHTRTWSTEGICALLTRIVGPEAMASGSEECADGVEFWPWCGTRVFIREDLSVFQAGSGDDWVTGRQSERLQDRLGEEAARRAREEAGTMTDEATVIAEVEEHARRQGNRIEIRYCPHEREWRASIGLFAASGGELAEVLACLDEQIKTYRQRSAVDAP